jgi:hypothetical protein
MRTVLNLVLITIVVMFVAPLRADDKAAPATQPSGASGTWKWSQPGPNGDREIVLKLKQDGEKLTGTITGFGGDDSPIEGGKVEGDKISFKVTREFNGNQITTAYSATLSGDALKGKSETIFNRDFQAKRGEK